MKPLLDAAIVLPIVFLLLELLAILGICFIILSKAKVLNQPLAGMEYSQAIFAASIVFAVVLVATIPVTAMMQTYKTFSAQGVSVFTPLLTKAGQYFLVVLFFEVILLVMLTIIIRSFQFTAKAMTEIRTGNIPLSILLGVVIIAIGMVVLVIGKEMIDWIVPKYVNLS